MHRKLVNVPLTVAALLIGTDSLSRADVVTDWNLITINSTKTGGLNTNLATRIDAIESIAVYDAVNSIRRFGTPYHYAGTVAGAASPEAAAAQAAHDVLVNYFPAQQAALDTQLTASLAAVPDGAAEEAGRAVGRAAAADIIALRADDGSASTLTYPGPVTPQVEEWRPTPGATAGTFPPGINQQWGRVKPFALPRGNFYRPGPPPPQGSPAYNRALAEVEGIGAATSTTRTVEQTNISQFYKQDAEVLVNEAARSISVSRQLSLESNALVFALVNIASADARIAVFDAKYFYKYWRPITALNADADGAVTNGNADWTPFLVTPSHPSYPSGHSTSGAAGFEVLEAFFGDRQALTLHTSTPGQNPRTINRLSQVVSENGLSRIYGGIHFSFDNLVGQALGKRVADYVLEHGPRATHHGQ